MTSKTPYWTLASAAATLTIVAGCGSTAQPSKAQPQATVKCDTAGLSLPPGFCATVFADNLGHARHMAVAADGTVYLNTWSGRYYQGSPPPAGGFLIALKDANGDGRAESATRFGPGTAEGNAGGVGIALYNGALYAETNDKIVRYALPSGQTVPSGAAETIVSGLPLTGDHPMHPFVIAADGSLFVNSGSATNSCEKQNRMPGSMGNNPCTELETRAGIWKFDASKTGQMFSLAARYATGIRNSGGQAFDGAGNLFATQHGRDQLSQNWPKFFTPEQGPELPAEELVQVTQGGDYGWPMCFYDGFQNKLVLAPEYGGDGKTVGLCAQKTPPVAAFPAHWAPNDLLIYQGSQFPAGYRGGAFLAFHGSWNRAPAPQAGYNVVFQPMANGHATGKYILFADGFAGANKDPGGARARPAGLAMAPDGALYIADDVHGRIWRVTYQGPADSALAATAPVAPPPAGVPGATPPEGVHADAGRATPPLAPPPGFTADQIALGDRIFHGETKGGTCSGCHGSGGEGTPTGPKLTGGPWLWTDGSVPSIVKVITTGVAKPKQSQGAMPPKGGAPLSGSDVQAVAAYVWTLGHAKP